MHLRILILTLCSFIFFSCKDDTPPVVKTEAYSRFLSPGNNSAIKLKDSIKVLFNVIKKDVPFDSAQIFFDNNLTASLKSGNNSYSFVPSNEKLGIHKVSLKTFFKDGKSESFESSVRILSDVIPKSLNFTVVKTYPHSKDDFTQGFEFYSGFLYESTGREGTSFVKKKELATGKTLKEVALDKQYFGEGITILDNKIYQLTWKSRKGFVYNLEDFKFVQNFTYGTEGWGMTNNGKELLMSDGTNKIYFMNPLSFSVTDKIEVFDNAGPVIHLNELEYSDGIIYANVWQTFLIVKIDAATGKVLARIDLEELLSKAGSLQEIDVLNGITINPATKNLLVTGKLWNKVFEIKLGQ